MKVRIEYCGVWNYRPQAARVAAAVERETGLAVDLVEGSGGVFTVSAGGRVVWSKASTGRFPSENEVVALLRPLAGDDGASPPR